MTSSLLPSLPPFLLLSARPTSGASGAVQCALPSRSLPTPPLPDIRYRPTRSQYQNIPCLQLDVCY
eukprot:3443402-Rhodomonas_salina.1